jgi:hypothetical protein
VTNGPDSEHYTRYTPFWAEKFASISLRVYNSTFPAQSLTSNTGGREIFLQLKGVYIFV